MKRRASVTVKAYLRANRGTVNQIAEATRLPFKQVASAVRYMRQCADPLVANVEAAPKVRGCALRRPPIAARLPLELAWQGATQ